MQLTQKITIASSLAVLAAAGAWALVQAPHARTTPAVAEDKRVEPERGASGRVSEAPVVRPSRIAREDELRMEVQVEPAQNDAASPGPSPAEVATHIDAHERELVAAIDRDDRDAWAVETERAIGAALETEAFAGARLVQARCASQLCRVEIGADGEDGLDRFVENAPLTPPFATSGLIRRTEGEDPRVVLYFGRPGFRISPHG